MSIVIKFYTFSKKENSTKQPSGTGDSFDCLIKTPSSLMFPYIELQSSTNPVAYNYAYISDFGRYYFVNDWKFDRGLWYASLTVDVLATYKTQIGSTSMYVLRASQQKNGYIKDILFPATGKVTYDSTIFESGAGIGYKDGYFLVTTVGSNNNAGQTIWQMNASQFNTVMDALMASANGYSWGDLTQGVINSLFNPTDYIVSAFWFPQSFSALSTPHSDIFMCGLWSSGQTVDYIDNVQVPFTYTVDIPKHPQASSRGAFLNLSPFTTYELDLGFTQTIPLDPSKLVDVAQILVTIYADPMTGIAKVEGRTVTLNDQMQLFNLTCNYGVPISIAMGKNNINNTLANIGEAIKAVAQEDPLAGVGSAVGIMDSAISGAIGTVTNTGSIGSIAGHLRPKRLFSRFFDVVDNDNANLGSPLCKVTTPSTLGNGYIKAQDCDISLSAPASEIMLVKSKVMAGFFYE